MSSAAIGERRDAGAVRQDFLALRSQRREPPPVVQQREAEPVTPEPYADVAPVDEAQGEKTPRAPAADGERAGVEPPHDRAPDA